MPQSAAEIHVVWTPQSISLTSTSLGTVVAFANEYFRERAQDIRDIGNRVTRHLAVGTEGQYAQLPPQSVIVARELLPSETIAFDRQNVVGIVTEEGGPDSHAAILDKSVMDHREHPPMELVELVKAMRIVELSAKTWTMAIRALAEATNLETEGVLLDDLLAAIEEREIKARTIVGKGFAMPHAIIDWDGEYRLVLGRSRAGVDYGIPHDPRVHLIVLFAVGQARQKDFHLALLAGLAELLESNEFRRELVKARDTRAMEKLLLRRVGLSVKRRSRLFSQVLQSNTVLLQQAIELTQQMSAQGLMVAVDKVHSVPWELLAKWEGRLLVVTAQTGVAAPIDRQDTHVFEVPQAALTRTDRAKLGLLLAGSAGLLVSDADVVCVSGPMGQRLDSIILARPEAQLEAMFSSKSAEQSSTIPPAVILRALSLAVDLAAEGREGRAVGAMFVIGDTDQVLKHVRQLVLNPFHGYDASLRRLFDPSLSETIKEFAQLDGAFIVQDDGIVVSAGTYVIPKAESVKLPSGLGTRHQAAAAITATTRALAITVSQSDGTVTLFQNGKILMKLERATPMRS